jgi:hypothetical protein
MHFHGTSTWRPHDSCQEKHNGKVSHFEICPNLSREAEHRSELGKHILMLVWIDQAGNVLTTLGFR